MNQSFYYWVNWRGCTVNLQPQPPDWFQFELSEQDFKGRTHFSRPLQLVGSALPGVGFWSLNEYMWNVCKNLPQHCNKNTSLKYFFKIWYLKAYFWIPFSPVSFQSCRLMSFHLEPILVLVVWLEVQYRGCFCHWEKYKYYKCSCQVTQYCNDRTS